jgi:MoxR-like ATPase
MRIQLGYPDIEAKKSMLKTQQGNIQHELETVMDISESIELQDAARQVYASDELLNYILRLVTFSHL